MRVLMLILGVEFLELLGRHWEVEAFTGIDTHGIVALLILCLVLDVIKK